MHEILKHSYHNICTYMWKGISFNNNQSKKYLYTISGVIKLFLNYRCETCKKYEKIIHLYTWKEYINIKLPIWIKEVYTFHEIFHQSFSISFEKY